MARFRVRPGVAAGVHHSIMGAQRLDSSMGLKNMHRLAVLIVPLLLCPTAAQPDVRLDPEPVGPALLVDQRPLLVRDVLDERATAMPTRMTRPLLAGYRRQ